jgi:hypothetical protein
VVPPAEEGRAISALLDRAVETGALEGVQAAVRDGLSGVLVLRGEAGVGRARVLHNADELHQLSPGEVLVCESTSPNWTPAFPDPVAGRDDG